MRLLGWALCFGVGMAAACSNGTTTDTSDLDASDGTSTSSSSSGGRRDGSSDVSTSSSSSTSGSTSSSSSSTGGDDGGDAAGGDGAACDINVDFGSIACNTCATTSCCAQLNACFDPTGSDCDQLDNCLTACASEAGPSSSDAGAQCANDCFTAHAASKSTWVTQAQCMINNCKTQCG